MGQYGRMDSIKRSCTKFLAGKWKAFYESSSKATSKPSKPTIGAGVPRCARGRGEGLGVGGGAVIFYRGVLLFSCFLLL